MQTGKINVQTENIFPIIKKFLYSDHEIFLRELVSNAVDATQKLKTLVALGEAKTELGDVSIEISVDKKAKTITVKDKGIGMTAEEVEKYINQIAFSGAEEFVQKYKDKAEGNAIIGHFGLGFYSAFMVSAKVELISRSFKETVAKKAVKWECDGSPEYQLTETTKKERGTEIIMHIAEDSEEFLENARIETLLKKYCKFLPVEIKFDGKVINNTTPAWTKKPADLSPEDYKNFYNELYPFSEEPLFHIHLNVDYPFNLTGILYFPRLKKGFEVQKDKIQLYCNQVFVTDSVENIVPDFLTLLRGVIDSPDIPLNVSRSYLQSDSNVKKISAHITKKVADKLEDLFKNDRKDFEAKWEDIKVFIEYGMLSEEKFFDKVQKIALFKNTENTLFTFEEYAEKIKISQMDKDKKVVYLYTNNPLEQHGFIQSAKDKGYDVLVMDTPIDPHFINFLEQKMENISFVRVDADTVDKLIQKDETIPSKLSEEQINQLKPIIEEVVPKEKFSVSFENMSETENPMIITQPEFMRRMKDMSAMGGGGGMNFMGNMPEMYNLIVNSNNPIISKISAEKDKEKQKKLLKQTADLAMLSQNLLKGEALTTFVKRSLELID
ncbi:MAG: molecular chaperone HtpG [Bacteroidia bacterium]